MEGSENKAEGVRRIEVFPKRLEGGGEGVGGSGGTERRAVGAKLSQGLFGGVQRIQRKVELLARVAGEERIAEGGRAVPHGLELVEGVEVAQRLAHLLAVHKQVLAVIPVVGEGGAVAALALGDLVFVVGEEQVHAAGMEVDGVAEVLFTHGAALDVPAGAALAPGRRPEVIAIVGFVALPEGEVGAVFFFVGVVSLGFAGKGGACTELALFDAGKRAIAGKGGDLEVNGSVVGAVGVAAFFEG